MKVECNVSTCPAGKECMNQQFSKSQNALLEIFYTGNKGWGVRCKEDIRKGEFVVEYMGDIIDTKECADRMRKLVENSQARTLMK